MSRLAAIESMNKKYLVGTEKPFGGSEGSVVASPTSHLKAPVVTHVHTTSVPAGGGLPTPPVLQPSHIHTSYSRKVDRVEGSDVKSRSRGTLEHWQSGRAGGSPTLSRIRRGQLPPESRGRVCCSWPCFWWSLLATLLLGLLAFGIVRLAQNLQNGNGGASVKTTGVVEGPEVIQEANSKVQGSDQTKSKSFSKSGSIFKRKSTTTTTTTTTDNTSGKGAPTFFTQNDNPLKQIERRLKEAGQKYKQMVTAPQIQQRPDVRLDPATLSNSTVVQSKVTTTVKTSAPQNTVAPDNKTTVQSSSVCSPGFFLTQGRCLKCPQGSRWNGTNCIRRVKIIDVFDSSTITQTPTSTSELASDIDPQNSSPKKETILNINNIPIISHVSKKSHFANLSS